VRGRRLGDAGADDPAADDQEVEAALGELLDPGYAVQLEALSASARRGSSVKIPPTPRSWSSRMRDSSLTV
jgi:hypothetical protein